jgi:Fe-S-cluster containining protein
VLVATEQRFTCAQCGRCCQRTTVPVTAGEAEAYRKAGAGRWFREGPGDTPGAGFDPFEPIPEHAALLRIRKRPDGACGFLSPEGLCRIHEELGADRKPIACRVFPFRFHPIEGDVIVTTSFACPTVIANEGKLVHSQTGEINTLHLAWKRALPEAFATVEFVSGRRLPRPLLPRLRSVLTRSLDIPNTDGEFDVRTTVRRIASLLDDLSRRRVLRLSDEDFTRYFEVMSQHVLSSEKSVPARPASRLARLLFRGFLLTALSVQLHLDAALSKRRSTLRLRLLRLGAHVHGVGPGAGGFDLALARKIPLDINDPAIREIAMHYLRSSFGTIGTGRRAIVDEIAVIVAHLNTACVLARMHAARHQKAVVDADSFTEGLLDSADLAQADDGGRLSGFLTTFAGGMEGLYLL